MTVLVTLAGTVRPVFVLLDTKTLSNKQKLFGSNFVVTLKVETHLYWAKCTMFTRVSAFGFWLTQPEYFCPVPPSKLVLGQLLGFLKCVCAQRHEKRTEGVREGSEHVWTPPRALLELNWPLISQSNAKLEKCTLKNHVAVDFFYVCSSR